MKWVKRNPQYAPPHSPFLPGRTVRPSAPPVIRGAVLGFRAWVMEGHALRSTNKWAGHWIIDTNCAVCKRLLLLEAMRKDFGVMSYVGRGEREAPCERAPDPACQCGLYGGHTVAAVNMFVSPTGPRLVYGAILAWGQVEVHSLGFRAEYAKPVMLAAGPCARVEDVAAMASEHELPVTTFERLEKDAARFGRPIPRRALPPPADWYHGYGTGNTFAQLTIPIFGGKADE